MSNNLPEWTAQAFVAAGAVFLLISAYWMGVYVPNAKELSDDFESEISFDGDMTLLNSGKFATLQGDFNPANGLDTFKAEDGTNAVIVAKADPSGSDDERTLYNFNASAYSDQERTNRIITFSDSNSYVDRTTYETKSADDENAEFAYTAWNPNYLPEPEDTLLPNPFVPTHMNTYKYVGEEEIDGIDCYKYQVDEDPFSYSSDSVLLLKATFDGLLPAGVAGESAGEMLYKETIWVSKETGQVADRFLDVVVNFAPDARLAANFVASEDYSSEIMYSGNLDGQNVTATRATNAVSTTVAGKDNATKADRNYIDVRGTLVVLFPDDSTDEKVNTTFTIDTKTLLSQEMADDGTYISGNSTFFTVGATCAVNDTHIYGNLFFEGYDNDYTCVESTTLPGYIIPAASIMGNTPVNHYQSVENDVYYGKLDSDGDGTVDTPSLPVFDPYYGYCMNSEACPDRQWSSLIAYALTLTALGEGALQIPVNSTSSMDLPSLGTEQMVIDGTALLGSQYHPIIQASFTDIDAYAASLGLTNPDGSAITYASMPFAVDPVASDGFQLPQLGGEGCVLGSEFHSLVQGSLAAIPGYQGLCIDVLGNTASLGLPNYPEICGFTVMCGSENPFGSDFHPFFQTALSEVPGYEDMQFITEGGMTLPMPGNEACVLAGACVMGNNITHPLVVGILQQVMLGLEQDANNYTAYPWVLSDNMTLPVPGNLSMFENGTAKLSAQYHPVIQEQLAVTAAYGVNLSTTPWVLGPQMLLPTLNETGEYIYGLMIGFEGCELGMCYNVTDNATIAGAVGILGNRSNPSDPTTWFYDYTCTMADYNVSAQTCVFGLGVFASLQDAPLSLESYMPAIDYYLLPKSSVADIPIMLDSKFPVMDYGAALPVLAPQTLDLYMDYEENVWVDPVTGTVLDQVFNITVSIHFPWGTEQAVQTVNVAYTEEQKLASSESRWNTEFGYTYLPGSPLRADNSNFVIMTLKGEYSGSEKTDAIKTIEDTTSALKTGEQTVPTLLIGLAMVSLAGGFYTYYQNQGGSFGMGMDEFGGEEEPAPSMATTTEEDTSEAESADDDSDGESEEE